MIRTNVERPTSNSERRTDFEDSMFSVRCSMFEFMVPLPNEPEIASLISRYLASFGFMSMSSSKGTGGSPEPNERRTSNVELLNVERTSKFNVQRSMFDVRVHGSASREPVHIGRWALNVERSALSVHCPTLHIQRLFINSLRINRPANPSLPPTRMRGFHEGWNVQRSRSTLSFRGSTGCRVERVSVQFLTEIHTNLERMVSICGMRAA